MNISFANYEFVQEPQDPMAIHIQEMKQIANRMLKNFEGEATSSYLTKSFPPRSVTKSHIVESLNRVLCNEILLEGLRTPSEMSESYHCISSALGMRADMAAFMRLYITTINSNQGKEAEKVFRNLKSQLMRAVVSVRGSMSFTARPIA